MANLQSLTAESISDDALNAAVASGDEPSRDVFERAAVGVRDARKALVQAGTDLTTVQSEKAVAEGKVTSIKSVLAGGGNYPADGDPLQDITDLRSYGIRMREMRTRIKNWADQVARKRGQEGEGLANTILKFLEGLEPPAIINR